MKVNGYQIRETLSQLKQRREVLKQRFDKSLFQFPGDNHGTPINIGSSITELDEQIAQLQEFQSKYNLHVETELDGRKVSLAYCIKRIHGAGLQAKRWQKAETNDGTDRWSSRSMTRKADEVAAVKMIGAEELSTLAQFSLKFASEIRGAVAIANAHPCELPKHLETAFA